MKLRRSRASSAPSVLLLCIKLFKIYFVSLYLKKYICNCFPKTKLFVCANRKLLHVAPVTTEFQVRGHITRPSRAPSFPGPIPRAPTPPLVPDSSIRVPQRRSQVPVPASMSDNAVPISMFLHSPATRLESSFPQHTPKWQPQHWMRQPSTHT